MTDIAIDGDRKHVAEALRQFIELEDWSDVSSVARGNGQVQGLWSRYRLLALENPEECRRDIARFIDHGEGRADPLRELTRVLGIVGRGDDAQLVEASGHGDCVGASGCAAVRHQDRHAPLGPRPIKLSGRGGECTGKIGRALAPKPEEVIDHPER